MSYSMVSKFALIGLVILVVGLIVGVYGVYTPVSAQSKTNVSLLNTQTSIDANDYASKNVVLNSGQTVNIQASIANKTTFFLYIMNQSQYYVYYGCAPACYQPLLGGNGTFWQQANETEGALVNVSSLTPSSSYSGTFTAPSNGTYYFVMDNTIGPSMATYIGTNASKVACNTNNSFACNTIVTLSISTTGTATTNSANWVVVGAGVVLLLIGGAIATLQWGPSRPARPATPKPATTPTVPPKPAPT